MQTIKLDSFTGARGKVETGVNIRIHHDRGNQPHIPKVVNHKILYGKPSLPHCLTTSRWLPYSSFKVPTEGHEFLPELTISDLNNMADSYQMLSKDHSEYIYILVHIVYNSFKINHRPG